jgi:hypothetical protein
MHATHPLVVLLTVLGFCQRTATLLTGVYYLIPVAVCLWFMLWKLPRIQAYWKQVGETYRNNLLTRLDKLSQRFESIQEKLARLKKDQGEST